MKLIGVKIVCERSDGEITTWHDGPIPVSEVIESNKTQKGWAGGTILEAYYEFDSDGLYIKTWIDVKKNDLNALIR